jgi:hypothetical protein
VDFLDIGMRDAMAPQSKDGAFYDGLHAITKYGIPIASPLLNLQSLFG